MRAFRFLNLAILSALVTTSAALYAQNEQQEKPRQDEPKRQEEPKRQAEPKRQEEARPSGKQDEMKTPRQDETRPSGNEQNRNEQRQMEKPRDEKMGRQESGQHHQHARPAGKSAHIPDEKFHAQFGRAHAFHAQRPVIVGEQPQFQYGGYTFVLVDDWPADWDYNDDVYVDYVDGDYFLYDLRHPGMRIALFVEM